MEVIINFFIATIISCTPTYCDAVVLHDDAHILAPVPIDTTGHIELDCTGDINFVCYWWQGHLED